MTTSIKLFSDFLDDNVYNNRNINKNILTATGLWDFSKALWKQKNHSEKDNATLLYYPGFSNPKLQEKKNKAERKIDSFGFCVCDVLPKHMINQQAREHTESYKKGMLSWE